MLGIVIVNRNHIGYMKDITSDLSRQTGDFELTIYDNASIENGTFEFLTEAAHEPFVKQVMFNKTNVPLNHLWNRFYKNSIYDKLCFMNNDMRLPRNFVQDTLAVFNKEPHVGCVVHTTNHLKYQTAKPELSYEVVKNNYRQGWDFSMRRVAYNLIPKQLHFFCGDDFLFEELYRKSWKLAYVTSSPIIHYQGKTKRSKGISNKDIRNFKKLGYHHNLNICKRFSNFKPTFSKIIDEGEHI